ncbi:restriction endonuclease subunit S [Bacillus vallismortis]|uniref:restriction endonuclease subunit S n=1 Tax=Bacillus vallismortis TaxID=72361 RepID=UPI00227E6FA0|nr:restriction endonuclease subunit S [Bacillus vallismortis]MCY8309412.1 restriction endonuclease subunit S [Bacillus vallismortis]MCY8598592.1 restriction endonuclease subunit S [Bacillus vallismortis]
MSDKIIKLPKIRFAGFTDAWEQRSVSDFAEEAYGGGTPKTSVDEYWGGNLPWIQSSDLAEHQVSDIQTKKKITKIGLKNSAAKLVPANSIAIVTRVGVGKLAFMQFEYATSQDFLSITKMKVNEWFGVYSLYKKLQTELHAVQGTSIKGITKEELMNKKIIVPVEIDEQQKIGSFFKKLDETITLHQRKLELLKNMKKSLLQKMFPKDGANVPEIRFAGFADAWEQHSLSKVGDFVRASVDPQATPHASFVEYSMPSYDNGRNPETVFGDSMQSIRLKISGDVLLINKLNVRQKRIWFVEDAPSNAVASSEFMPFTSTEIDLAFLEQLMLSDKTTRDLESISSGTSNSQKRITPSDVLKYIIKFPVDRAEQEKIGSFFKNIDNLIIFHQRKLNSLKNLKKSLLQQMFI